MSRPKNVKLIATSAKLWGQKNYRKEFMVHPDVRAYVMELAGLYLEQAKVIDNMTAELKKLRQATGSDFGRMLKTSWLADHG